MSELHPRPDSSFTPSGPRAPGFAYAVSYSSRDAVWILLRGELDHASAPLLTRALADSVARERLIVIDLRGLGFMDSAGLRAVIAADAGARRRRARLVLIRGPGQIQSDLVGLPDQLAIVDVDGGSPAG